MEKTTTNKTSMLHIRVKPDIKQEAEDILDNLGMTTTEAVNIYLKQIILNCGLPFEVKMPQFSDEMLESIAEAEEMKKHPEKYKTFESVEEFMEDLHNEIQNTEN